MRQKETHVLRGYYQQNYINALKQGDVALTMAWSGDIFAAKLTKNLPEQIEFVIPDDGALIWTDNMCIPKGAAHLADAMTYMDFVYQPKIAAQIAQYVNYISPVPDAKPVIEQMAAQEQDPAEATRLQEVAESPLVFPTDEEIATAMQQADEPAQRPQQIRSRAGFPPKSACSARSISRNDGS